MSEIGSAELHSKLFRRRHSTRQSHGLFALAKLLLSVRSDCLSINERVAATLQIFAAAAAQAACMQRTPARYT